MSALPTIISSPVYISFMFSFKCDKATRLAVSSSAEPVTVFDMPLNVSNGWNKGCKTPKKPEPLMLSKYKPVSTVFSTCLSEGAPLSKATVTGYLPSDTAVITVATSFMFS